MKYYVLNLKNNKSSNPIKIKNVKLVRHIPDLDIEDEYEGVEVLAYEVGTFVGTHMIDVITGKSIFQDDGNSTQKLQYKSSYLLNEMELNKIKEKYDNLSDDEIERYKKGINEIENVYIFATK